MTATSLGQPAGAVQSEFAAHSGRPCSSRGRSPDSPAASRIRPRRSAGSRLTSPSPRSRAEPQQRVVVGEQPVQPVGRRRQQRGVEPPPALVLRQHVARADVLPAPPRRRRPPRPAPPRRAARGSAPAPPADGCRAPRPRPAPAARPRTAPRATGRADRRSARRSSAIVAEKIPEPRAQHGEIVRVVQRADRRGPRRAPRSRRSTSGRPAAAGSRAAPPA